MTEGDFGPEHVNVAAQRRDPDSLLNWMERLIRRRRECPEIGWGELTILDAGEASVLAHRCDWDGSAVLAVHQLDDRPVTVRVPLGEAEEALVDLFGADELLTGEDGAAEIRLGPYGFRWFRVRRPGQRLAP
jgi:maltose alpha-D-glucosyltransferase/alpha-amylase